MKIVSFAALLFLLISLTKAQRLKRCQVARQLKKGGLDGYHGYKLENWVCLVFHTSRFNLNTVGPTRKDGNRLYGLFQLNSRWWCSNGKGKTVNGCRTSCSKFVDNDLRDDIECAKRIVRNPKRMNAWAPWRKRCKGRNLSRWTKGCKFSVP